MNSSFIKNKTTKDLVKSETICSKNLINFVKRTVEKYKNCKMIRTPRKSTIPSENIGNIKACQVCKKEIKNKNSIGCDICQNFYHASCIKMNSTKFSSLMSDVLLKWVCNPCESSIVFTEDKKLEKNILSKEEMLLMLKKSNDDLFLKMSVNFDRLNKKIDDNTEDTNSKIQNLHKNVNAEITYLKQEVITIKAKVDASQNLDSIIPQIEKKLNIKDIVVESINRYIGPVESEIDKMSRISNLSNLIIDNIPETNKEDLFQIIYSIGDEINVNIGQYDLNNVFRINSKKKVKSIMVCFQQKRARDFFYEAYLSKIVYLNNIGFTELKGRLYINEHLTSRNSEIIRKLRFIKSKDLIKKCYTRNGICHLVYKELERPYKIVNDADLQQFLLENSITCDFDENNNRDAVSESASQITAKKQGG